ncbi:hypothetical protein CFE70_008799 [Pyrenophora teres f. teres 0-1]|uniref:F-box domain-containing protein n=2 Tax=Pyrenophora teres f. teres TaxID=97479 RepID=E3RWP5_PYRTT|nr:hypothetical protein PTT_13726 [Pyrenophora teres f. teres 0-1]KAE8824824.1 hypothetical protein PTNB85_09588 [Pyrenophora teres f. teres]KAE8831738.1 hypothetical protein HRS9139_05980 [Pyrenophora teres f. teres]KAE8835526.1 hypothetical protein HRS9122_07796 [Pyrenophora teres f. teres]KAE8858426.1 hypothetical protein PTNB29_07641 [Pyrenophora teres f. teres]
MTMRIQMGEPRKEPQPIEKTGDHQSEQLKAVVQIMKHVHRDKLPGDSHKVDSASRILFDQFKLNKPNQEYKLRLLSEPIDHHDTSNNDTDKHADLQMSKSTGIRGQGPLSKLPPELRRNIFRHLLVFKQSIQVICESKDPMKFAGFTRLPPVLHEHALTSVHDYPRAPGLELSEFKDLFAIAATNRENCELAREVYYKENRFVMPRDGRLAAGFHCKEWLKAIGPRARWFLADVTFEVVRMENLPYTKAEPGDIHEILKSLGESAFLRSLVIRRFLAYGASRACDKKMKKALKALFDYRGLMIFTIGNMPELEASFASLVTRPKDLVSFKEQPAYTIGNSKARTFTPFQYHTLMNYKRNILQYLYVHTRSTDDKRDHISSKAMEKEFQERVAEAAIMCKKTLVDKLIERGATWMRGAQDLKDAHDAYLRENKVSKQLDEFPDPMDIDG